MNERYRLGVDLGTTFTAAAIARDGHQQMVRLGSRSVDVASMVAFDPAGEPLLGDAAEEAVAAGTGGFVREFKRRLGDPVPLIVSGRPCSPQTLMAHQLAWTVGRVSEQEGRRPDLVAVTCPANWGPYKHELLRQVINLAEVPDTIVCTEPEAAAIRHAGVDAQRDGARVGVYDLGGGTFDAAVLRPTASGVFRLAGRPDGVEHLGGIDFDEAVYSSVLQSLGQEAVDLSATDDPAVLRSLTQIRRSCVLAKEQLSTDQVAQVTGELAGRRVEVRVTRQELEAMIRPALDETVKAFARAVRNAGTDPGSLTSVVLVGGSVRIPLVFETVSRRIDCQVVMPREPGHSVALGAAMAAERYRVPSTRAPARVRRQVPEPVPASAPPQRDATVALRELTGLPAGGRALVRRWHVAVGDRVALGQPLAEVCLPGPAGGVVRRALRSPFEGVVHRHFVEAGDACGADDLLAAFREVTVFLVRPGRALPGDQGVLLHVPRPTSPSARTLRPVVMVDRAPRAVWWSATFCLLTPPGAHVVSVACTGRNQWFGFASREVDVAEGDLAPLVYTDPGTGATAGLRPVAAAVAVGAAGAR